MSEMINSSATQLDEHDLEQHRRMLAHLRQAQALAAQAEQLQAQTKELFAALRVHARDLHERYALDASAGEGIDTDGNIIRNPNRTPEAQNGNRAQHPAALTERTPRD